MFTQIWTQDSIVESVFKLSALLGRIPSATEYYSSKNTPTEKTLRRVVGNWSKLMELCGLPRPKPFISPQCREASRLARKGKHSHRWKGGRSKRPDGYIKIYNPDHPCSSAEGYILEHRMVMCDIIKRPLQSYEIVHHKNGIKDDNRPENLELLTKNTHKGSVLCPYCNNRFCIR